MDKDLIYLIFMFFNTFYGLSAASVIGGGIYLIIKIDFNEYIIIILASGLIMTLISIIGCISRKRPRLLFIYMILICLIFFIELALALVLKFYTNINDFVKNNISEIIEVNEEEKEKILNIAVIILLSASGFCLLSFLCALFYYRKLKEKERKYKEEKLKGDAVFQGLDYTNLNPDMTTASN